LYDGHVQRCIGNIQLFIHLQEKCYCPILTGISVILLLVVLTRAPLQLFFLLLLRVMRDLIQSHHLFHFIKSLLHKSASVFQQVRSVAGIGSLGGLGYSAGAATTFHSEVGYEIRKKTHNATTSSTRNVYTGPTFSNMIYNRHREW